MPIGIPILISDILKSIILSLLPPNLSKTALTLKISAAILIEPCPIMANSTLKKGNSFNIYRKMLISIIRKGSLLRVLVALSNTVKDVGYIQGLNSIVGVALTCLKEEEAFWMLLYMMEKLNVKDILNESFTRINILNYQLQTFLDAYLPELSSYLVEIFFLSNSLTISK